MYLSHFYFNIDFNLQISITAYTSISGLFSISIVSETFKKHNANIIYSINSKMYARE